ncbi:molybdenum cofactor biosynthesis protein B [Candidatus Uabimicrobium amorphum]|uniref:Molybdenum cofactor biosynthesis protein B n=1 Tax=Uabimicrobium amorphum TaxID=2596890 RepID=A0A5S9F3T6_UABAM|nr:molybdenum cofactor biosynthesis protein B [Candidatus Uabimicrobium amorphum]BBM84848.1 molybdenum cofactor biosynthesis protein B [Candidatus Uabimicrobium amorphum]
MQKSFQPLKIAILKISDTRTEETDTAGQMLKEMIESDEHTFVEKRIVPDCKYHIRAAISVWAAEEKVQVVITTGGTGLTGRDCTPEAVLPLLDKEIMGFGEIFRAKSFEHIGMSTIQSRALAGIINGVYIFCLPGSKGACKDGWNLIRQQLDPRLTHCNLVDLIPRLKEK